MSQYQDIKNSRGNGNGNGNGNGKKGMSRRDFFKWSAGAAAAGTAVDWALVPTVAHAAQDPEIGRTICPYCSVGCGMIVRGTGGNVTDIQGDSEHVISRGGLCSKGAAAEYLVNATNRVTGQPCYRLGNNSWQEISWDAALSGIAARLKTARGNIRASGDNSLQVAFLGSSHMTNEENYLYRKLIANFGTSNVEHQARI